MPEVLLHPGRLRPGDMTVKERGAWRSARWERASAALTPTDALATGIPWSGALTRYDQRPASGAVLRRGPVLQSAAARTRSLRRVHH